MICFDCLDGKHRPCWPGDCDCTICVTPRKLRRARLTPMGTGGTTRTRASTSTNRNGHGRGPDERPRGSKQPIEVQRAVLDALANGGTIRGLAIQFGVGRDTIRVIRDGVSRKSQRYTEFRGQKVGASVGGSEAR